MQLTEEARIKLVIDGQEAANYVGQLSGKIDDLKSKQGELGKRTKENASEYDALKKEINGLQKEYDDLTGKMNVNEMTVKQLEKYQRELLKATKDLIPGTEEYITSAARLKEVNGRLTELRTDFVAVKDTVGDSKSVWESLRGNIMAAFTVAAVIEFGKQVFNAGMAVFELTGKFEKYETVLKNTLGSQTQAKAAMEMIKDIAATTPISVDEMTESFIKMVNRGLTPSKIEIKNLADLAASQGKSFDQLTEAVLDAMMGEGERLKEFGVKMKKNGDDVSLSFKGQTVEVQNNEEAIYKAIVAMGGYNGVAGTTSEMNKTLEGRSSNLGDAFDSIQLKIGEKLMPVFVGILELFAKGVDWLGKLIDASGPVGSGFMIIWDALGMVFEMGKSFFLWLLPDSVENMLTLQNVMRVFGTVLGAVGTAIKLVFSSVQLLIDGFLVLKDAGSIAVNVLKGDFAAAAKSSESLGNSWETLKGNASKNFGGITESFKNIWAETKAATKEASSEIDMYGNKKKVVNKELTDDELKEIEKRKNAETKAAEAKKTANEKALNEIAILRGKATNDEVAQAQAKYNAEKNRIEKLKIDETIKATYLQVLHEKLVSDLAILDDKYTRLKLNSLDQISAKEFTTVDASDKMNERLFNRVVNWEGEKERANTRRQFQELAEEQKKMQGIEMLMQGDLVGYANAMGKKLDETTKFKLAAVATYVDFFQKVAGFVSDNVGKFADAAKAMIDIAKMRGQIELNLIEKGKQDETKAVRKELKNQEDAILDLDTAIAKLEKDMYFEKDEKRKADLQLQINKLKDEREAIVIQKNATGAELAKIEKDYDNKTRDLKISAWEREKKLNIAMAIINGIVGFVKALGSSFPPINFAMAALVGVATAVQVAKIRSEPMPSFGEGTFQPMTDSGYFQNSGVLGGLRHNTPEGGNWVINPRNGKLLAKVEEGEFLGVFSRQMTKRHGNLLRQLANSSINKTGKPIYAEDGYLGTVDGEGVPSNAQAASDNAVQAGEDLKNINTNTAETVKAVMDATGVLDRLGGILSDIAESSRRNADKPPVSIRQVISESNNLNEVVSASTFG
jgi:hypothetical protein